MGCRSILVSLSFGIRFALPGNNLELPFGAPTAVTTNDPGDRIIEDQS